MTQNPATELEFSNYKKATVPGRLFKFLYYFIVLSCFDMYFYICILHGKRLARSLRGKRVSLFRRVWSFLAIFVFLAFE